MESLIYKHLNEHWILNTVKMLMAVNETDETVSNDNVSDGLFISAIV